MNTNTLNVYIKEKETNYIVKILKYLEKEKRLNSPLIAFVQRNIVIIHFKQEDLIETLKANNEIKKLGFKTRIIKNKELDDRYFKHPYCMAGIDLPDKKLEEQIISFCEGEGAEVDIVAVPNANTWHYHANIKGRAIMFGIINNLGFVCGMQGRDLFACYRKNQWKKTFKDFKQEYDAWKEEHWGLFDGKQADC